MRSIETLRDNLSVPFGIAILPGYDAALPPAIPALLSSRRAGALRLLAVDYALLPPRPGGAPAGMVPLGDPLAGVSLYRLARPLPRVFLGFRAERLPAAEAREQLLDEDVVAGRRILLERRRDARRARGGPGALRDRALHDHARDRPL